MTHYVLIDGYSGYVWEEADAADPIEACRIVDRKIGGEARTYREGDRTTGNGYFVYEAPADWVPVQDGTSQSEIERVTALPFACKVEYDRSDD